MPDTVSQYIFGNSLVNFAGGNAETNVPHWMGQFAETDGNSYATAGGYGFLREFADRVEPLSQWGFSGVDSAWDSETTSFADAGFDEVYITPANYIQDIDPDSDYFDDTRSPLDAVLDVVDDVTTVYPEAKIYVYEGWADMAPFSETVPPAPDALAQYHTFNMGEYHDWFERLVDQVNAADPDADVVLVPVASVLSELLTTTLSSIPAEDLYVDNSPHGTETLYYLASMVTYQASYGTPAPLLAEQPPAVHSDVFANYDAINDVITVRLTEAGVLGGSGAAEGVTDVTDAPEETTETDTNEDTVSEPAPETPVTEEPLPETEEAAPEPDTSDDEPVVEEADPAPAPEDTEEQAPVVEEDTAQQEPEVVEEDMQEPSEGADETPTEVVDPVDPDMNDPVEVPTESVEEAAEEDIVAPADTGNDIEADQEAEEPVTEAVAPETVDPVDAQPEEADAAETTDAGALDTFYARYFAPEDPATTLTDIDFAKTPDVERYEDDIDFVDQDGAFWADGPADNFAAHYSKVFTDEDGGTYQFDLTADDDAVLLVDGEIVLNNMTTDSDGPLSATLELAPGEHEVEIMYLDKSDEATLQVDVERIGDLPDDPYAALMTKDAVAGSEIAKLDEHDDEDIETLYCL